MESSKSLQFGKLGGQISCNQWFSMSAFSQFWVILAVWARKAFSTPEKRLMLCRHIWQLKMVFLHFFILEMGSFPMSVANNFCDQPLPKYLDSKTVLIYCPHPVYSHYKMIATKIGCFAFQEHFGLLKLRFSQLLFYPFLHKIV